jgi:hypothetical protein
MNLRRRPREGGDPYSAASPLFEICATWLGQSVWVPAFAGMTAGRFVPMKLKNFHNLESGDERRVWADLSET